MNGALAVVTARGGSKSLPRKNLAALGDKPLIAWTIEAAQAARSVTRMVVSTDDPEIAEVARSYGAEVPFLRPAELASDSAASVDAVIHAVEWLQERERYTPDVVLHLQPTSPLRTAADIDAAIGLLASRAADAVVSVTPVDQHPYWMKCITDEGWLRDVIPQQTANVRRQDLPSVFLLNGAIYAARREVLLRVRGWYTARTMGYVMPAERSIDIDTAEDVVTASDLLAHHV